MTLSCQVTEFGSTRAVAVPPFITGIGAEHANPVNDPIVRPAFPIGWTPTAAPICVAAGPSSAGQYAARRRFEGRRMTERFIADDAGVRLLVRRRSTPLPVTGTYTACPYGCCCGHAPIST